MDSNSTGADGGTGADTGTDNPLLAAALFYAARGWAVLPLHTPIASPDLPPGTMACDCHKDDCVQGKQGKHPRIMAGFKGASVDPATIRRWWSTWPHANVGIRTGALPTVDGEVPRFLAVLDVDPRHGGDESLDSLTGERGPLPETALCLTGGGGRHFFFEGPAPCKTTSGAIGPGLDTRGGGGHHGAGYVVAAPSLHASGRRYGWELSSDPTDPDAPCEVVPAPAWLIALASGVGGSGAPATVPMCIPEGDGAPILDGEQGGPGRKKTLLSQARRMRVGGATEGEILAALAQMNTRCVPPLSDVDVARMAHEGAKKPPGRSPEWEAAHPQRQATGEPASTPSAPAGHAPAPGAEELTEGGNAARFVRLHAGRLAWDGVGWLAWDGARWAEDRGDVAAFSGAAAVIQELRSELPSAQGQRLVTLAKHVKATDTAGGRRGMLAIAGRALFVNPDAFDVDQDILVCPNGVLDLRTGTLGPHDSARRVRKATGVTFDPTATDPAWTRFLDDISGGDPAQAAYLQRVAGYLLTGHTSEDRFFMLVGGRGAGKSTWLNALARALGDYARKADFETFCEQPMVRGGGAPTSDLAALQGRRLVYASEGSRGAKLNSRRVKDITGGEEISAREVYKAQVTFRPTFKLCLGTNFPPRADEEDPALLDRLIVLRFPRGHSPDDPDPSKRPIEGLREHLADPARGLPAVFAWAVAGAALWYAEGLGPLPGAVTAARAAYRAEQSPIGRFLADRCAVAGEGRVTKRRLYAAYREWCGDVEAEPLSNQAFAKALRRRLAAMLGPEHDPEVRVRDPDRAYPEHGWSGIGLSSQRMDHSTVDPRDEFPPDFFPEGCSPGPRGFQ